MDNNRTPLVAVLGPLVGFALLIIGINAGANYLQQGQEEMAAATAQAMQSPLDEASVPASAAEESVSDDQLVEPSEVLNETEGVTESLDVAGTVDVTGTMDVTGTESVESSQVATDTVAGDGDTSAGTSESAETLDSAGTLTETGVVSDSLEVVQPPSLGQGGQGRGMGGSMMRTFHMAPIPDEYAGMTSPIPSDEESIARGEPIFQQNCAVCHGPTGLGDGPAAAGLDPTPPMIAMTSQNLGDDYLIWRISEGGAMEPFNSAMPAWKTTLDEQARWDLINYVRSLGRDMMAEGGQGMGMSAEEEAVMRAEMLATGVDQGVITPNQADVFDAVHTQIDERRAAEPDRQFTGTMRDLQDQILEELVADGTVAEEDAAVFRTVLGSLEEAGLIQ